VMTVGPKVLQSKACGAEAKHFLVPTDLSPESLEALPYGTSLAKATQGDVRLVYVRDSRSRNKDRDTESVEAANARLRELLQVHPDVQAITPFIVRTGAPAEVVIGFAEEHQMDLIVMGRRAWSEHSPPIWRTAYAIVTQAACPVLSMQSTTAFDAESTSSTQGGNK
jgi:nucleotide-binding universal stress UspA family protein